MRCQGFLHVLGPRHGFEKTLGGAERASHLEQLVGDPWSHEDRLFSGTLVKNVRNREMQLDDGRLRLGGTRHEERNGQIELGMEGNIAI